jgi:hypothetical protein
MLVQTDGEVASITPGGYVDHFDSGQVAIFDTMVLHVRPADGREPVQLRVILDGADRDRWRLGLRLRFDIDEQYLTAPGPVFEGTLQNIQPREPPAGD